MIRWATIRGIEALIPLVLAAYLSDWLARAYPPAFTGNACPGTTIVNGKEIVDVCGMFPWGTLIPVVGVVLSVSVVLRAFSEYQRRDEDG